MVSELNPPLQTLTGDYASAVRNAGNCDDVIESLESTSEKYPTSCLAPPRCISQLILCL